MNRHAGSLVILLALPLAALLACGGSSSPPGPSDPGAPSLAGTGSGADGGSTPGFGGGGPGVATGPFTDFPAPVVDPQAPANAPALFGGATAGSAAGPCVTEPEPGALYPRNWLRPRFKWRAAGGENLFELRLHAGNQTQDLLVYTSQPTWTMPKAIWDALGAHSAGSPMTLTIRGGVFDGTALGPVATSTQAMGVAPADAGGSIVYWTTTGTSQLKGFSVGDEGVVDVLQPSQVKQQGASGTSCIGCHVSTPDGASVAFSFAWNWGLALAGVTRGTSVASDGLPPSFLGAGATTAMEQANRSIAAFSPAHWSAGDHAALAGDGSELVALDLEATDPAAAVSTLARTGDAQKACDPAWSHDGARVAYVSSPLVTNGRPGGDSQATTGATSDLYAIPYAARKGGAATPIGGASDPAVQEYYPAYSPDDHLLAFNVAPNGVNPYDAAGAEVAVVSASGGKRVRLAANDPPACMGVTSPGVHNSWGRWSPQATTAGGSTYYWLVFSSKRASPQVAQLYLTSVVVAADGTIATHGAVHLWNQPETESNHTPAWDVFQIPPAPAPPK